MKYLHFLADYSYSKEFIEYIQSNYNIEEHQFIVIKYKSHKIHINPKKNQNIKFLTLSRDQNILKYIISQIKFFTIEYRRIKELMKHAKYILIHYLTEEISAILFRFKGKAKISWFMWGGDLYHYIPFNLYDNFTSELNIKLNSKIILIFKKFYHSFHLEIRKRVIKRIDYVISPIKGDIKLLKKYFKTKAEWFSKYIYPNPIDFEELDKNVNFIKEEFFFDKNGCKLLLLGNSGDPSNNHLDIIIRLSGLNEQNFKIICPLSYGPPIYIKKVIEKGKMLFGDRFIPLLKFLKPNDYFQILKQIDLVVMYHNRQQGLGNINILIYLGKPICMKKNSAFFHLNEIGISVFSTQDLEKLLLNEIKFTEVMSKNNKNIISKNLSVKSAISSIENLFMLLEDGNNG